VAYPDGEGELARLCAELARTNDQLGHLLRQEQAEITQLCVTDREPAQQTMHNFPVPGARRLIVRRAGTGGSPSLAAGVPTLVVAANENRLGGALVNVGNASVTLFLAVDLLEPGSAQPLTMGAPQIGLNANGGAWDFRLGSLLWCGNVIAIAATGGTSLTIAEV